MKVIHKYIPSCIDCPYFYSAEYTNTYNEMSKIEYTNTCSEMSKYVPNPIDEIPEWCPLEDA